jgi:ABC-type Zn2+ transport system substrate-binding protein/surface adhesin
LKVQSGQQQQELTKSIALAQQLETELSQNVLAKDNQNRQSIEQISHQLSQQTQALTQLISVITQKPYL